MQRTDAVIYALTAAALAGLGAVRLVDWAAYEHLLREDGPVEYLTAILFLAAAVLAARVALASSPSRHSALLAWLAAAALLWLGGEEISWGQRIVGWDTPEAIMAVNTHEETNLHNMAFMQSRLDFFYIAAGLYGMCGWWLFDRLTAVAPRAAAAIRRAGGDLAVIGRRHAIFFVPIFVYSLAWYLLPAARESIWLPQVDEEVVELLFAVGVFMHVRTVAVGTHGRDRARDSGSV